MYDRLPLYIVALYPAMMMLAYEIVRSLGVFREPRAALGAVCVGFVHHCFYEIFDQLGPQLRWWAWNTDNAINRPMLASVPMSSVLLFATVGPALVALFTQLLVAGPHTKGQAISPRRGAAHMWRRRAGPCWTGHRQPADPVCLGADHADGPLRWGVYVLFLAAFAVVALPVLLRQWRTAAPMPGTPNPFVQIFGPVFLVVIGALWLTALPAYLNASNGFTSDGTPTGNAVYAAACFLLAVALTIGSVDPRPHDRRTCRSPGRR